MGGSNKQGAPKTDFNLGGKCAQVQTLDPWLRSTTLEGRPLPGCPPCTLPPHTLPLPIPRQPPAPTGAAAALPAAAFPPLSQLRSCYPDPTSVLCTDQEGTNSSPWGEATPIVPPRVSEEELSLEESRVWLYETSESQNALPASASTAPRVTLGVPRAGEGAELSPSKYQ